LLDASGARAIEPALREDTPLQAALHFPGEAAANSRQFVHQLKQAAQAAGVQWRFQCEVLAIEPGRPLQLRLATVRDVNAPGRPAGADEALAMDAVVVCAAQGAPELLLAQGRRVPFLLQTGHSITAPLRLDDGLHDRPPRAAVLDQRHQVSIARQGDRLRVAGGLALGAGRRTPDAATLRRLYRVLDDWFPGAAQTSRSIEWCGARLALPDGLPLIGPSGVAGVWLNTAHGASGWTLACGAARLLAAQLGQRAAPLEPAAFGIERLR
jgi:D-amino-acid dehydrogenase